MIGSRSALLLYRDRNYIYIFREMKRLKKILCEDLLIVDMPVGTVYVSFLFFFLHMLAVCNPWGWGEG